MVKRAAVFALLARGEAPLSAERDGQDALILGKIEAGWTQALRLAKRDRLPVKRSLDARVDHINREAEASHRIPAGHRANGPVVVARIAGDTRRRDDVLPRRPVKTAEQAAVDDSVIVADLRVGPVHRGREV